MAFGSLLALVDDIAAVLDDVALMTKIAAKKSAGVLGDDLAVNAERVLGVRPDRELPVVWAVAKGSFINKLILVPAALLISAFIPILITPLLVCGGLYLCFEGAEKLLHGVGSHSQEQAAEVMQHLADPDCDLAQLERDKIRGAVRTDFILSAEIIVLTLGVVEGQAYLTQLIVLAGIATLMTIGVYGLVAGIVKIDDLGLLLNQQAGSSFWHRGLRRIGAALLWFAPRLMKGLSVVGTVAMFLVGGGILVHAMPSVAHGIEDLAGEWGALGSLVPTLCGGVLGLGSGYIMVKIFAGIATLRA
jgi:predicted DNA repair protein MutK